ncbi:hypothetical protein UFOVP152_12 [uncultured Caudovirales phage]|uniref:Uncharacterized protein n=1 Tax=uncultured Caudovirales phage TaxID=2100421 RepID=A0A6J7W958_9CAUD|nr:hypothetical protein UFOVP152_12 [uncultured Caudovirales phage]
MASEVDIANAALALLGDAATVTSLYPAEGSAQASHCARFYPIARDSLLEMSTWGFSTTRVTLAQVTNNFPMWAYAYQSPADMVNTISVLPSDATDDYAEEVAIGYTPLGAPTIGQAFYEPQPYALEWDPIAGIEVVLTNQDAAVLRYTRIVTDTTLFSPTFVVALTYWLAGYLAGPIIKGDAGMKVAEAMHQKAMNMVTISRPSDANQGMIRATQSTPWMTGR